MKSGSSASYDFAKAARAFCDWCEASDFDRSNSQAAYFLSRLYSQALLLPIVEPEGDNDLPKLPSDALAAATANLAAFAGWYYREVFDPNPLVTDEPGMGDIGDDLLDTYKDIRAGLVLYERGETVEALWHWSFLHRIHWGRHAVGAMYALHCLAISQAE